ncbi:MAG TPA: regulatory protein RecX [Steroidobacter sp.]|nr:regulatory protein RecX [Steroidobacter sp.]
MRRFGRSGREAGADSQDEPGFNGDLQQLETAAVRLLARREYSSEELRRKLLARGGDPDKVQTVLDKLSATRMLSDQRYAASFVHHHTSRGQGPVRIRAELRQQGVNETLIEKQVDEAGADWATLAAQVRRRRFGDALPRDARERAKQARFLQYRGFTAEQIRAALKMDVDADFEEGAGGRP